MVLVATGSFCVSLMTSGVFPDSSLNTLEKLIQHFQSLKLVNLFWIVSLPGVIGLSLLKRREEFVRFFIKMFCIISAVMIVPVALGFLSVFFESETISPIGGFAITFVVWILLSIIGAYGMAQREYIFGGHKRDTAWKWGQKHDR